MSGPTAPKAAQISAFMGFFVIGTSNQPDLVAAFSIIFLSGLILVAISFLGISRFIHFTPYPVVAGFMCGIGVIVIITQVNAFVGLEVRKDIHDVILNLDNTIQNINIQALYVSIPSLFILFAWPQIGKKIEILSKIPAPLITLIVGTMMAYAMNLNIPYIGDKISNTSEQNIFSLYIPDFSRIKDFFVPALALAGLAVLDSLLSCKVADNMIGDRHNSDRETFGQGMANMAAGLMGGVTTATATMRTVANIKFGGQTPLASIVHGLTLLAILLGMSPLVAAIPAACLAAILFKVGIDIMDYRILPVIRKIPKIDLLIFSVVLFITVYEDLMIAIAVGVVIAILAYFKDVKFSIRTSDQYSAHSLHNTDFADKNDYSKGLSDGSVQVFTIKGPVFFGSVESLLKAYSQIPAHKALIIDLREVTSLDITGAYALEDLVRSLQNRGIPSYLFSTQENIRQAMTNLNIVNNIGDDHYLDSSSKIFRTLKDKFS